MGLNNWIYCCFLIYLTLIQVQTITKIRYAGEMEARIKYSFFKVNMAIIKRKLSYIILIAPLVNSESSIMTAADQVRLIAGLMEENTELHKVPHFRNSHSQLTLYRQRDGDCWWDDDGGFRVACTWNTATTQAQLQRLVIPKEKLSCPAVVSTTHPVTISTTPMNQVPSRVLPLGPLSSTSTASDSAPQLPQLLTTVDVPAVQNIIRNIGALQISPPKKHKWSAKARQGILDRTESHCYLCKLPIEEKIWRITATIVSFSICIRHRYRPCHCSLQKTRSRFER